MKPTNLLSFLLLFALPVLAVPGPMKEGRRIVWHDEFNGDKLDMSKWAFVRTMSARDIMYDNSSACVRVENDCLHLQVHASGDSEKPWALPEGVTTLKTMAFRYGYLEMRAKVPFRHGAWPSFWMQSPKQYRTVEWLAEVDIFEVFSSGNSLVANIHKWTDARHVMLPGGENAAVRTFKFSNSANLNNEFHVYAFEWNPKEMKFYVDGTCFATFPIDEGHDFGTKDIPGMKGFHDFQSIIFNNEIFTSSRSWCPEGFSLTPEDPMPIDYYIDWIRLWQAPENEELKITPPPEPEIKSTLSRQP